MRILRHSSEKKCYQRFAKKIYWTVNYSTRLFLTEYDVCSAKNISIDKLLPLSH